MQFRLLLHPASVFLIGTLSSFSRCQLSDVTLQRRTQGWQPLLTPPPEVRPPAHAHRQLEDPPGPAAWLSSKSLSRQLSAHELQDPGAIFADFHGRPPAVRSSMLQNVLPRVYWAYFAPRLLLATMSKREKGVVEWAFNSKILTNLHALDSAAKAADPRVLGERLRRLADAHAHRPALIDRAAFQALAVAARSKYPAACRAAGLRVGEPVPLHGEAEPPRMVRGIPEQRPKWRVELEHAQERHEGEQQHDRSPRRREQREPPPPDRREEPEGSASRRESQETPPMGREMLHREGAQAPLPGQREWQAPTPVRKKAQELKAARRQLWQRLGGERRRNALELQRSASWPR